MSLKRSLVALLMTTVLLSPAESIAAGDRQIEGTWEVTIALQDPNLPPSFEAVETYAHDGGFLTSNNMPFLTRVGQGTWQKAGQLYTVKIKFFKFEPNGLPSGTITVSHTITLESKNEYTGTGTAVFCELDGTTCQSADFNSIGKRLS